jgi:hypothetical protein
MPARMRLGLNNIVRKMKKECWVMFVDRCIFHVLDLIMEILLNYCAYCHALTIPTKLQMASIKNNHILCTRTHTGYNSGKNTGNFRPQDKKNKPQPITVHNYIVTHNVHTCPRSINGNNDLPRRSFVKDTCVYDRKNMDSVAS